MGIKGKWDRQMFVYIHRHTNISERTGKQIVNQLKFVRRFTFRRIFCDFNNIV